MVFAFTYFDDGGGGVGISYLDLDLLFAVVIPTATYSSTHSFKKVCATKAKQPTAGTTALMYVHHLLRPFHFPACSVFSQFFKLFLV